LSPDRADYRLHLSVLLSVFERQWAALQFADTQRAVYMFRAAPANPGTLEVARSQNAGRRQPTALPQSVIKYSRGASPESDQNAFDMEAKWE
ncbi:MAG: hypothetical protein RMJ55_02565, partial [Roseiflexaceae bacterium]|nr:hypothetical protein [Roseiflexaceae bacterium]